MGSFDDFKVSWAGKDYVIPAKRRMQAIAAVEDFVTLSDLCNGKPRFAKLAQAYAALLRQAGARLEDDEVYLGMFGPREEDSESSDATAALIGLLSLMLPPSEMAKLKEGSARPTKRRKAAA